MLANASLDIAFHDNNTNKLIKELNYENINEDYIKKFFVGLLEADGTITTNMRSNNNEYQIARIRIVIALKRNMENINMLNLIKKYVGGKVVLENKKDYEYVIWICQTKQDLIKIFALLAKYPALRTKKSFRWDQLSNSGDILKLLVPNYNGNIICGWGNTKLLRITAPLGIFYYHPYKVISQIMIEREIDNRGSKSTIVRTHPRNISLIYHCVVKE